MSWKFPRSIAAGFAAFTLLPLLLAFSTPAAAQSNTALVIDHSADMKSKIGDASKISIVRKTLSALFEEYESSMKVGVVTYGGGKSGNKCNGVKTLKPIDSIESRSDIKVLEANKPKGLAPLTTALPVASNLFADKPGSRPVIVIAGGSDTCRADPCAKARELKQQAPNMVIHVVALIKSSAEKFPNLSCMAEVTGGIFTGARNKVEFEAALRKAFEAAATGGNGRALGPSGASFGAVPGGVGTPGGAPATSNDPGVLELSVVIAKGMQPINNGVIWRLYDGRAQNDGSYRLMETHQDAQPHMNMAPGDYLINVSYGLAQLTKRVTVWPGKRTTDTFNLNAGGLRLYATLAKQPLISEQALNFKIFSDETDQSGNRRMLISKAKPGIVIRLNSGNYRVRSTYGHANSVVEADVKVEPGKLTEATLDHQAGRVTFKLVRNPGGEAMADTLWAILTPDGLLVKKSGGAFSTHVLAAGKYMVKATYNGVDYRRSFTVAAGDKKAVEVVMQ
ncbi:MAG: hypothetical protein P8Y47_04205 [Alphaproteobacteria bacterium]